MPLGHHRSGFSTFISGKENSFSSPGSRIAFMLTFCLSNSSLRMPLIILDEAFLSSTDVLTKAGACLSPGIRVPGTLVSTSGFLISADPVISIFT